LPAGVELIDFTGNVVPRTPELQLTSFPIFLRGSAGSQSTLATALSRVPVRSGSARQVLPFLEVTGTNKVELRMHNLLSRPAAGRLQVRRDAQTLYDKNITVNGTTTWSLPIELSRDSQPIQQQIQQQKVNVQFQPEAGAPAQISNLQVEVLSASRRVQPISVDGDLSDWPSQSAMTLPRRVVDFSAKAAPYGGDADLSGRLHAAWDKEHLYLAMEIQDDVFEAASSARMSWQGDGVQLYFDSWQNARGTTQQGYNGDDQVYDLWPGPNGVELHRAVAPEKQIGFTEPGIVANVQAATKRTATGYTLELAIPTRELAPINFQAGSTFGFALIVNDKDDATGRKRGLTLTPEGTEPHMRPDLYPVMVLKP